MKSKIYILSFSLILTLAIGALSGKFLLNNQAKTQPENGDFIESIVVKPGIKEYSEGAVAIVIGEVKTLVDHPNNSGIPFTRIVLDAEVEVDEVLKGDFQTNTVTVMMIGGRMDGDTTEDGVILKPGEKVLLFLGTDESNNYVVFAGSAGKVVIDENNNAMGEPVFSMSLVELKSKILDALDA